MNTTRMLTLTIVIGLAATTGCAYRHYLGMHGPSIRHAPDIHDVSVTDDADCLGCHSPDNRQDGTPATSHPGFKGCIKCHNDPLPATPGR
jgi:hypothetical protein